MRLDANDRELKLLVLLDAERVDLRDGLGEEILRIGLAGCRQCFTRQTDPRGQRWDTLAAATLEQRRRKGIRGSAIGLVTGGLSGGLELEEGDYQIDRDIAWWQYTREPIGKAQGFHQGNERTGQPPRPFLGWTRDAEGRARRLLARHDVRGGSDYRSESGLFDY